MGTLTITFSGICTHFRFGVVAGVPHRVVLPDASKVIFGLVSVPSLGAPIGDPPPNPVLYYTTPHFAQLLLQPTNPTEPGALTNLTIPGLMSNGDIVSGVRIQVANATDTEMLYDGGPPGIKDFVHDYNISNDVVLNGRAACYVDLFGGSLTMIEPTGPDGPKHASITVQTDGIPTILVSPLTASAPIGSQSYRIPLAQNDDGPQDITMFVQNTEPPSTTGAQDAGGKFDYLLHFLTAMGGIPERLKQSTPGMGENPPSATKEEIATALDILAAAVNPPQGPIRNLIPPFETTPSCSCSQYP